MDTNFLNDPVLANFVQKQPYPLLFVTLSGAHLYGFPSHDSDYDVRGVHILPLKDVLGLNPPRDTIRYTEIENGTEVDWETHDIRKFFELLLKKNGVMAEQILSPLVLHTTPAHEELKAIMPRCITRFFAHHYRGVANTHWELFQKNQRVKPLLYAYRGLLTGIHLMQTGEVEANLVTLNEKFNLPQIPELIARKLGGAETSLLEAADLSFHEQEINRLKDVLAEAQAASNLPYDPKKKLLSALLVKVRLEYP